MLNTLTIATAGHVDHGKSTLVKLITGTDTDTLAEEKSRGLSINLGFAYLPLDASTSTDTRQKTIAFVDVPGHVDFTANMLAGVGMVDTCMLVIAADDGIMPQTREHLTILDLLGINQGCVVISKIDRVDAARVSQVTQEVINILHDTSLRDLPVFPVSAVLGDGIDTLLDHLKQLTLQQVMVRSDSHHHPRFAIDRSFTVAGLGTILTGSMASGILHAGDNLLHSASGKSVRIKRLRHHQLDVHHASRGQRMALNVDLPPQLFARGQWLMPNSITRPANLIDVRLRSREGVNFRPSSYYHLHLGPAHHIVTVRRTGDSDYLRLHCDEPMFASFGDRLIMRDPSSTKTLAGGVVIDVTVSPRRRSIAQRVARLRCIDQADPAALVSLLDISTDGVDLDQYAASRNLSPEGLATLLDTLNRQTNKPVSLSLSSNVLLGRKFFDDYTARLEQLLGEYHQANPYHAGMNPSTLAAKLKLGDAQKLLPAILQLLIQQGRLRRDATSISLAGHQVKTDPEQIEFMQRAKPLLIKGGFTAPRTFELAESLRLALVKVEKHLRIARQAGQLIQVAPNRHYLPETIAALAQFTEQLAEGLPAEQGFTVQQFRDASAVGRNLCIEILEYFDTVGFTRRNGNIRFLRTGSQSLG